MEISYTKKEADYRRNLKLGKPQDITDYEQLFPAKVQIVSADDIQIVELKGALEAKDVEAMHAELKKSDPRRLPK